MADPVPLTSRSTVSVTRGSDHIDNIFRAMQALKPQIAAAIGSRPVLIKTNNVSGGNTPLADTPIECVEGILAFLKSIGKTDVTVAEGSISNPSMLAFGKMGYLNLLNKYPVRFKSLAEEGYRVIKVWNYTGRSPNSSNFMPAMPVRISKMLLNPDYFVISACRMKTHDRVVATLSLKNIVMGSIIWDSSQAVSASYGSNDKQNMHNATGYRPYADPGSSRQSYNMHQDLNDTICMLSRLLAPDMSVIDAWQGMQGNGPTNGTAMDPQQAAIASLDFLSADRIATLLMDTHTGIMNINTNLSYDEYDSADNNFTNFGQPGWILKPYNWSKYPACLNYCGQHGVGQFDSNLIDLVGDLAGPASSGTWPALTLNTGLSPLVRTYILGQNTLTGQSLWMRPTAVMGPMGTDRRPNPPV